MARQVMNMCHMLPRYLEKSTVLIVFLNNCKDLKSTILANKHIRSCGWQVKLCDPLVTLSALI